MYNLTFTVNGIAEAKYYMNGTRDAGTGVVANAQDAAGTDTFYRGGAPVAVEHYNIYKMIVKKPDGSGAPALLPELVPADDDGLREPSDVPDPLPEDHPRSWAAGSVELYVSDSNCRAVDNCGPGVYAGTCTASRNVPAEPNLVIPQTYMGKMVTNLNVHIAHLAALSRATHSHHGQLRPSDVAVLPCRTGSEAGAPLPVGVS